MVSPKAPLRSIACLHKQRLLWHKGGFIPTRVHVLELGIFSYLHWLIVSVDLFMIFPPSLFVCTSFFSAFAISLSSMSLPLSHSLFISFFSQCYILNSGFLFFFSLKGLRHYSLSFNYISHDIHCLKLDLCCPIRTHLYSRSTEEGFVQKIWKKRGYLF